MEALGERLGQVLRALGAAARWVAPILLWALRAVAALGWLAVFGLVRLIEASKRTWAGAGLLAVACAWGFLLTRHQLAPVVSLAVLALAVVVLVLLAPRWGEYRARLLFAARAELHARRLFSAPQWVAQANASRANAVLSVVGGGLALGLLIYGWCQAGEAARALLSAVVFALGGLSFAWLAVLTVQVERAEAVRLFVPGWPLGDPRGWEAGLARRLPGWAPFLGWRVKVAAAVRPLARALEPLLVAPGVVGK